MLKIVRAEDELRFDDDLRRLFDSDDAATRARAALAAGRIGNRAAVAPLVELLAKDQNDEVRATAVFALGELEDASAADLILQVLNDDAPRAIRSRALEAAGKIAAANLNDAQSIELGETILDALEAEYLESAPDRATVLLGLTAVLRAKPKESEFVVSKFLSSKDARVRADALNTLARLRVKNDDLKSQFRALLLSDDDAIVRANAARAVGVAEDAAALELLIETATNDDDQRARVSAIRALSNLNDKKAAAPLLERAEKLLASFKTAKAKKIANPPEKSELLELAATLSRLLPNSNDQRAINLLNEARRADEHRSPEFEIALAKVAPEFFVQNNALAKDSDWLQLSSAFQGCGELASLESNEKNSALRNAAVEKLRAFLKDSPTDSRVKAAPDALRAFAAFKTADLPDVLQNQLKHKDVIVRATAAELIGEQPFDRQNLNVLFDAFRFAEQTDRMNDASLAALDAAGKQVAKSAANDFLSGEIVANLLQFAAKSPDYLVRRKTAEIARAQNPNKQIEVSQTVQFPEARKSLQPNQNRVVRADYARAIARKNNATRAIITTEKGAFTVDLISEDAPLTVDNFVRLARANRFNNSNFHRVVPNFVAQGGDFERGDGSGSPGYAIRDEINLRVFERGAVGMALSGKDTGGSQWFVTHSPQPHLDGGYTIFGFVDDAGMQIVDKIQRGDRILSIKIVETKIAAPRQKTLRAKGKNAPSKSD